MISELRSFLMVAEAGSFSAAAKRIGLTQAAIGAQIRRLERELGYQVFDRSGWAVSLTRVGRSIIPTVEDIIGAFDRLRDQTPPRVEGRILRVGAIATTQTTLFAPAASRLYTEFPELVVQMSSGTSMALLDRLDAGELDAALLVHPPFGLMSHMTWRGLLTQDYVMVVPADTPGELWKEIILSCPFIRYDSRSFGGRGVDRFLKARGVTPRTVFETEEVHTILQMVASNIGCAIVPDVLAVSFMPNIRVLPMEDRDLSREVGLMIPARASDDALMAFCKHLEDIAAETARSTAVLRRGGASLSRLARPHG
ncbi:LysR family transcriptional regulator [Acetobacter sp. TBRC 12305]|uniref:LysR family transcriptional regulator n=1 Tax=Acetobacter garciniae TaxID=2817435 RepID=A0A939KQK7_9PROT|nr:LysR family transcriptional regulator [Acetobacter garciniae]MBO1325467.1 LysR family transcriptional regulator [Acetobacter garciniae]MBX0345361.1 LysR family transcriptional regulator [Acetobacter garciniae]